MGTGRNSRSARRWSGKIGQYNMLHVSSRCNTLVGRIASMLGYQEWWLRHYYSGSVQLSEDLTYQLLEYTKRLARRGLNMQGVITMDRGQRAFYVHQEMGLYKSIWTRKQHWSRIPRGHHHLAHRNRITEVFIAKSRGYDDAEDAGDQVKDIRTLSNYIIFLLVDRPYMLPGMLYRQITRNNLTEMWDRSLEHQKGAVFAKLKAFFSLHDDPNSAGSQHVENLAKFLFTEKNQNPPLLCRACIFLQCC